MSDVVDRPPRDIETYRSQLDTVVNGTATASGPNGRLKVTMTLGRVAEVTADSR